MRSMMLLLLILLAGCGKPAEPPGWMIDEMERAGFKKPSPAPKPEEPGYAAKWNDFAIVVAGAKRARGWKMGVAFAVVNHGSRAAEWPSLVVAGLEATDARGRTYRVSTADMVAIGRLQGTERMVPAGGRVVDAALFALPPAGCGEVTFAVAMPDGKAIRWRIPEAAIDRSEPD